MTKANMPQRFELVRENYGFMAEYESGDYVLAEDVEPLVAEIDRLRARVEVLEKVRAAAVIAVDPGYFNAYTRLDYDAVDNLEQALKDAASQEALSDEDRNSH